MGHVNIVRLLIERGLISEEAKAFLEGMTIKNPSEAGYKSAMSLVEKYSKKQNAPNTPSTAEPMEVKSPVPPKSDVHVSEPPSSSVKEPPKIAVWDLTSGDIKAAYAQDLTLILVSEISKLGNYEVYSQENVRTLAGWTEERMKLGCSSTNA